MTLREHALELAADGRRIFPCWGISDDNTCECPKGASCQRPGKHPITRHGVHDATDDEAQVERWWTQHPNANIAIAMGEGLIGVDCDAKHDGEASFLELAERMGELPETASVDTGGGGSHFYFSCDEDLQIANKVALKVRGEKVPGVDIRGTGGYLIAPYSRHSSGKLYAWANTLDKLRSAPAWLVQLVAGDSQESEEPEPVESATVTARDAQDIDKALAHIDPDCDYEQWVKVGMALWDRWGGDEVAFHRWRDWSRKAPSRYPGDKELRAKWKSFSRKQNPVGIGTLFAYAVRGGYKGTMPATEIEPPKLDPEELGDPVEAPDGFPTHVIDQLEGPLKELVDWMVACSRRPDPVISFGAALSLVAGVYGRRVIGPDGTRATLTVAVLAPSGSGKDRPQECVKNLIHSHPNLLLGLMDDTPTHRAQLDETLLKNRGQMLMVLDEYGATLTRWLSQRDGASASMSPVIRRLATHGETTYKLAPLSVRHESRKENKQLWDAGIFCPGFSMIGFATEGQFYESLSEDSLTDGFLGRHIVLETKNLERLQRPRAATYETPDFIDGWLRAVEGLSVPRTIPPGGVIENVPADQMTFPSHPMQVGYAAGAATAWDEQTQKWDDGSIEALRAGDDTKAAILRRLPGQVANLSMVLACGEALLPEDIEVAPRHILLAKEICEWSAEQLSWRLRHGVAQDQLGKALRIVFDLIERLPPGKKIYRSKLADRVRIAPYLDRIWPILQQMPRFICTDRSVQARGQDAISGCAGK